MRRARSDTTASASTEPDPPSPPDAPQIQRRFELCGYQWVALPPLLAIPIAALAGAFGIRTRTVAASGAGIEVSARVASVLRYRHPASLQLRLTNLSAAALDSLAVDLDSAYATRFSRARFTPEHDTALV